MFQIHLFMVQLVQISNPLRKVDIWPLCLTTSDIFAHNTSSHQDLLCAKIY